jgi:hypothetical protein
MSVPSVGNLISYYSNPLVKHRLESVGIVYDFPSSTRPSCMACGYVESVQRAHIVPRSSGMFNCDHATNIHLLCPRCHAESEGLSILAGVDSSDLSFGLKSLRYGLLPYYDWMKWVQSSRYRRWQRWLYMWYVRVGRGNPRRFANDVFRLKGVSGMADWETQNYVVSIIRSEQALTDSALEVEDLSPEEVAV